MDVPVSCTGELATVALPVVVTVPVDAPGVAGAVYTTLTVQLAPAARVAAQFGAPPGKFPVVIRENGLVTVMVMPVNAAAPLFDNVSSCDALVAPSTTLPNASEAGDTLGSGTAATATSTAPISAGLALVNARVLPKKSWVGATELLPLLTATEVGAIE